MSARPVQHPNSFGSPHSGKEKDPVVRHHHDQSRRRDDHYVGQPAVVINEAPYRPLD
jgi:hypothetical protein